MSNVIRDAFLARAMGASREPVEVPELGITVYVKALSEGQRLAYNEEVRAAMDEHGDIATIDTVRLMAFLVFLATVDENGNRVFTSEADVTAIAENGLGTLSVLSKRIMEMSGMGKKNVEEVAANLKKAEISSTSDLPKSSGKRLKKS